MDGDEKKSELSKLMSVARDKSSATPANDCFDTPIANSPTSLPLSLANNNQTHQYSQPYYHQSINYNTGLAPTHASYSCAASEQTRTQRRDISSRPLASSMSVTVDADKRIGMSLGSNSLPSILKGGNLRVDHVASGEALVLSTSPTSVVGLIGPPVPPNCPPPRHPSKRDRLGNNGSFFRGIAVLATSVAKRPRRGFFIIVFLLITIMTLTAVTTASLHSTRGAVAGYSNRNGVIISPRISLLEHDLRLGKNTLDGQLENQLSPSTQEGVSSTRGGSFSTEATTLQTLNLALGRAENLSQESTKQSTSIIATASGQPPLGTSVQATQSSHLHVHISQLASDTAATVLHVNSVSSAASTRPPNTASSSQISASSELENVTRTESDKAEGKIVLLNDSYRVDIYGGKRLVGRTLIGSDEEWARPNGRVAVDPLWEEQVINASKRINELGSAMLASAARDLLATATYQRTRGDLHREVIDLRDAVEMEVNDNCTDNEESFFADTHNNSSDCGMLQTEFGMCHSYALMGSNKNETHPLTSSFYSNAFGESPEAKRIIDAEVEKALNEKRKPKYAVPPLTAEEEADLVASSGHQNSRLQTKNSSGRAFTKADMYAFHDLDLVKTPYAQGYVTVKGLEDPVDVGAAMLDEYRRIERGEPIEWPLAGVHASIDGVKTDTDEEESEDVSSDFRVPSARTSPFERKPYKIDFVYTEVDFSETTFQADRFVYKDRLFKPRAAGRPSPNDIRLGSEKAAHVLPFVWSHLPAKTNPEVLSTLTRRFEAASEKMIAKGLYNLEKGPTGSAVPSNASTVVEAFARLPRALYAQALSVSDEANRFRNFNELRYSLRSIHRYIIKPMERWIERLQQANQVGQKNKVFGRYAFGKIYIIVSHKTQMPPWMQEHERIVLVEHRDLFPVPSKSLPTFNSNAIESVIHRIPNLSRHYVYLNNDFMLARPVTFFDFFLPYVVWGGAASEPPTVKWLPKIMSCEAYQADRFGKNPKWNWKLSPRQVRTVLDVGKMIGPLPLGFAISFSHIPQMYDKLQVMRVMTEPSVRRKVCHTRAARERLDTTLPIMYAYQHFALLWRHGWGPEAGRRASKEIFGKNYIDKLFPQNRSHIPWTDFVDSRGRNRVIFWDYMTGLAESLMDSFAPVATNVKQRMVKILNLTNDIREVSIPLGAHFLKENELSGVERKLSVAPSSLAMIKYPANVSRENFDARRIMSVLGPLVKGANRILRRGVTEALLMPTGRLLNTTIEMHSAQANKTYASVEVEEMDVLMGPLERPKNPAYFDHWFLDVVRSTRDPIVGLIRSKLAFFGMGERSASLVEHKATLRRWKETNSVLFVTENDDMPVGSRDPSPYGFFGNMPKYLISHVCGLHASYWENSTTTAFSRGLVRARMLSTKASGSDLHDGSVSDKDDIFIRNGNELILANSSRKTVVSVVRNAARAPSAYFNINVDSVNAALEAFATSNFADYFRRYDLLVLRKKLTQVAAPSPSAIERLLGKLIASRIAVACRLEEAAATIEAMETSVREHNEVGTEDSKTECPLGLRFSDRAAHEKREKEIRTFRRHYTVQPSGPPPIPKGQSTRNPAMDYNYGSLSDKYGPPRHNCDLVPLAKSEVPPTADVHGVDIFLDIIRMAVGDCDSSNKTLQHRQPAWERKGC